MNANWLVPVIFAAIGLFGLRVLVLYFSGVAMDAMGLVNGFWLTVIGFLLAGVALRELRRRRGEEQRNAYRQSIPPSGEQKTSE